MSFEVDVGRPRGVCWRVVGYGDEATVLDPPELREIIEQRAAAILKNYAT